MFLLLALEPFKLEVCMAFPGFVKIVEFWLLKQRHNGWNRHYEHETSKVGSWNEFFDI